MQCFADLIMQSRSSVLRIKALEAVQAIIGHECALEAFQKQQLVLAIKPEEVLEEIKKKQEKDELIMNRDNLKV